MRESRTSRSLEGRALKGVRLLDPMRLVPGVVPYLLNEFL